MSIVEEFLNRPQHVLDRLIDGELGLQDRRMLLAALDDHPGAWRQCALAYIEAQTVSLQLSRMANEPLVAQEASRSLAIAPSRKGSWVAWPLALAASVLLAFVMGRQLAGRQTGLPASVDTAAEDAISPSTQDGHTIAVAQSEADQTTEANDDSNQPPPGPGRGEYAIEQASADSESQALYAAGRTQAITGELAQQFQRDGFEVDRQQQFWPVELPDGSSVLVPVEEMHIQTPDVERL